LKNYQYKNYEFDKKFVKGIRKVVDFVQGFSFEKELRLLLEKRGFTMKTIDEDQGFFHIPFEFEGKDLIFFIEDNTYGFGNEDDYPNVEHKNEFKQKIIDTKFLENNEWWWGYKTINNHRNQVVEIANDISNSLTVFKQ
jgi:hypothetical protein